MQIPEILTELDLIIRFGLKEGEERSREVSSWISQGLLHIDLSGNRYFRAKDVIAFFDRLFEKQHQLKS